MKRSSLGFWDPACPPPPAAPSTSPSAVSLPTWREPELPPKLPAFSVFLPELLSPRDDFIQSRRRGCASAQFHVSGPRAVSFHMTCRPSDISCVMQNVTRPNSNSALPASGGGISAPGSGAAHATRSARNVGILHSSPFIVVILVNPLVSISPCCLFFGDPPRATVFVHPDARRPPRWTPCLRSLFYKPSSQFYGGLTNTRKSPLFQSGQVSVFQSFHTSVQPSP